MDLNTDRLTLTLTLHPSLANFQFFCIQMKLFCRRSRKNTFAWACLLCEKPEQRDQMLEWKVVSIFAKVAQK